MFDNIFATFNDDCLGSKSDLVAEEIADTANSEMELSEETESSESFDDDTFNSSVDASSFETLSDLNWDYLGNSSWDISQFDGVGDPITDANCWQQQEGQNSCAVVAQISVYESIAGVDISEAEACQIAEANGWFDPETGTSGEHVGKILNELGIPTQQSYDATLDDIATALEQGDKVIVGLDANEIWTPMKDPATGSPIEQSNAGHAVWVTGIDQQPDGSVKIILNDSGTANGQMMAVDAEDFLNSWADHSNLLVVADAPEQTAWA